MCANYELVCIYAQLWASKVAQWVKNPPAMQEMQIWFLGWEDPLEEGAAIHSNIFFLENPMDRGAYSHKESGMT